MLSLKVKNNENYNSFVPIVSKLLNVQTNDVYNGISNSNAYLKNSKVSIDRGRYISIYAREQYRSLGSIGNITFKIQVVLMSEISKIPKK